MFQQNSFPSYQAHRWNHSDPQGWNHCGWNTNTPPPSETDLVTCVPLQNARYPGGQEINLPLPQPSPASQRRGTVSEGTLQSTCSECLGKQFSPSVLLSGPTVYCLSVLQMSLLAHTVTPLQTLSWRVKSRASSGVCSHGHLQDHTRQQTVTQQTCHLVNEILP